MLKYTVQDKVAVLGLDDGKANAVGNTFIDAVNEGLDRALDEAGAVLITGRAGVFSAGFDLQEFKKGPQATTALVNRGAQMLLRIFQHPQPVVVASGGHAIAAGALMLLAADTRIGASGNFKIGLNETAIGMTLPDFGLQLAAARLSKRHQTACVIQAQLVDPATAQDAGFLDQVVSPETLTDTAMVCAAALAELPAQAYAGTKLAMRAPYIDSIKASLAG